MCCGWYFIWMVTPQDFVHVLKTWNYFTRRRNYLKLNHYKSLHWQRENSEISAHRLYSGRGWYIPVLQYHLLYFVGLSPFLKRHQQRNPISSRRISNPNIPAPILKEKNIKRNWSQPTYINIQAYIHAQTHMLGFKQEGILCGHPLKWHEGISLWIVYVHYQHLQAVFWSWMTYIGC